MPFHLKAIGLPSSLRATISTVLSPSRSASAGVVLARTGVAMVSSSLQSLPRMMRSWPVVAPVLALSPPLAPNDTNTISADVLSLGRSATTGELATKLLVSSVHSHWICGEKAPTTTVPLQAAATPGGTLPGMQTPAVWPSLRQPEAQQYVSP